MLVRSYKYDEWVLRALSKIAHKNSNKKKGVVSIAALTRFAIYLFLLKYSRYPTKITKELIDETAFKTRKKNL